MNIDDLLEDLSTTSKKESKFTVRRGTDLKIASHIPYGVPSRIPVLDLAFGRPGYPAGRVVEMYGFEASGKSCAALAAVASVQQLGGNAIWIDTERVWDPFWAQRNGCNPDNVLVAETDTIEGIFQLQDTVLERVEGTPTVIVADSITAVPSKESLENDYDHVQRLGTDARAIRTGMRKLNNKIANSKAVCIYINHSIANASSMPMAKKSQSAGGHGLKFYASIRLEFARVKTLTEGTSKDDRVRRGMNVAISIEKNKVMTTGAPKVEVALLEDGFDLYENLFDALVKIGEIERINNVSYLFKPTETRLKRSEWKPFVKEHCESIEKAYNWFIKKSAEKGLIRRYTEGEEK